MSKNQKGFTLIEMIVVITVIGFLTAGVLAAVGNLRSKGRDSQVQSLLNEGMALLESYYDPVLGSYDVTVDPTQTSRPIDKWGARLNAQVGAMNGANTWKLIKGGAGVNAFVIVARAPSGAGYFCVDSSGNSKLNGTATNVDGAYNNTTFKCN